jgi:hypothetical protein
MEIVAIVHIENKRKTTSFRISCEILFWSVKQKADQIKVFVCFDLFLIHRVYQKYGQ